MSHMMLLCRCCAAAAAAAAAAAKAAAAAAAEAATAAAEAAAAAAEAAAAAAEAAAAAAEAAAAAAEAATSIANPTTNQTLDRVPPMSPQTMESLSISSPDQVSASNSSNSTSEVMSVEEKYRIVRSVGEECIQEDELLNLLTKKPEPVCYDGFEPSGRMHIAQADICQLGMDQRKVNVLAREYCDDIKRKNKPIILSHHMLPGLQQGQEKMSKSDPSSSIFMEDEEAEVNLKIKKAYCPPMVVEGNPCLEYLKYIIFPWFHEFKVERGPDNGGEKTFNNIEELVADYESGQLHPGDLKPALSKALNKILQPVRDHFKNDPAAKELLKRVKGYKVTR